MTFCLAEARPLLCMATSVKPRKKVTPAGVTGAGVADVTGAGVGEGVATGEGGGGGGGRARRHAAGAGQAKQAIAFCRIRE